MSINITAITDTIYANFMQEVLATVSNESPKIIAVAMSYGVGVEKGLKDLAIGALNGELSFDFVVRRLEELKTDFFAALISIEQIIASDVQSLVNKLISFFEGLLKSAIISLPAQSN